MDRHARRAGSGVRRPRPRVQLFQRGAIQAGEKRNRRDLFEWEAGAGDDHKLAEGEQPFWVSPGGHLAEGIHADDEKERIGKRLAERLDRFDAVGAPRSCQFNIAQRKLGIVVDGEAHHLGAVVGIGKIRSLFVGRVGRRDEEDPIEIEMPLHRLCDVEVPVVDRVERASEEADAARRRSQVLLRYPFWIALRMATKRAVVVLEIGCHGGDITVQVDLTDLFHIRKSLTFTDVGRYRPSLFAPWLSGRV